MCSISRQGFFTCLYSLCQNALQRRKPLCCGRTRTRHTTGQGLSATERFPPLQGVLAEGIQTGRPAAEETALLRTDTDTAHYWAGFVLCAGFVLNVVSRVEQAEVSTGWWLCAGRVEVLIALGTFSVISLWLYW